MSFYDGYDYRHHVYMAYEYPPTVLHREITTDAANWANPSNWYHDHYQRAWNRRFWFILVMLHILAGFFTFGSGIALILPAVLVIAVITGLVIAFLVSVLGAFGDWWNGSPT